MKCLQFSDAQTNYVVPPNAKYYKVSESGQTSISSNSEYYKLYGDHDGLYLPAFYELDSDYDNMVIEFDLSESQPIKRVISKKDGIDIVMHRVKDRHKYGSIKNLRIL